jgi:hypothetical protein
MSRCSGEVMTCRGCPETFARDEYHYAAIVLLYRCDHRCVGEPPILLACVSLAISVQSKPAM